MQREVLQNTFEKGILELGLNIDPAIIRKFMHYLDLLLKWNKAFNLTSIDDPESVITLHFLDSLTIAPYIKGSRVIDVGTGAGFPGIPLALVHPDQQFTLLDSLGKKTRFLVQTCAELGLKNVEVVQSRVEDYQPKSCYDDVVTRAFTQLNELINLAKHLCCQNGRIWAMKGIYPDKEIAQLPSGISVEVIPLHIPKVHQQRHLVRLVG